MPDRLDRDIEEVLDNIEDFQWHRRHRRGRSRLRQAFDRTAGRMSDAAGRRFASFTAGHLMMLGFLLLILGMVFRLRGPGTWFVVVGILFFVAGLFWSMRAGGSRAPSGRGGFWRDRYITYEKPQQAGWLRRFRRGRRR